jgi:carbamoyltransferase
MNILGLNYIFHDSAACLIKDGVIVHAVEEERLSRQKHTQAFPLASIKECLDQSRTSLEEVDHIAVSIQPGRYESLKLSYATSLGDDIKGFMKYEFERTQNRNLAFWSWYHTNWPASAKSRPEVHFVDHHNAHAAGTYYVGPWESAALLSIDGWGEWSTTWIGHGRGKQIQMFYESVFPHSLGAFYSAATEFCGFKPNYDEGKTMGLAPCGDSRRFFDLVDSMVHIDENANVTIDISWFDYPSLKGSFCGRKFHEAFGSPRQQKDAIEDRHCDVAAAFQAVLEKSVLKIARRLRDLTGERHLIHSGGVALNSVANGRILEEGIFDDVFLMPGAGDNGTAIGAAAYVHSQILDQEIRVRHSTPYLGRAYSDDEILAALIEAKLPYEKTNNIALTVARALQDGLIVGWFQGRMEFGPRALGARSILADPTDPRMKDKINAEVKHREPFRPFAPSVIRERAKDYFDIAVDEPYMLKVAAVRSEMRDKIPAIVHVDGTARIQTVDSKIAPGYHALITEFGKLSGHPVVLNTSFNIMGEPIVESPTDALRCFFSTGLDLLAMGSFIVRKSPQVLVGAQTKLPADSHRELV